MEELQGRILDRKYQLIRQIGAGGMGAVWEAEHTAIRRRVAVKVMSGTSPEHRQRFFREAQAAGEIGHPNIVEIYDVGVEEDGTAYMVMELLKGVSLGDLLLERKKLPPGRVVAIVLQVLSALEATHQKGIIHRDLKPDNVFLSMDARMREEVKLLDFGIAKTQALDAESIRLTKSGAVLGTPLYLSPEQAAGSRDIDARIDIWAIGVMMYEMLAGQPPFNGENYNEVIRNILMKEPQDLRDLSPLVPEELSAIVSKALCKDRAERYRDVEDLMDDLMPFYDAYSRELGADVVKMASESATTATRTNLQDAQDLQETLEKSVGSIAANTRVSVSSFDAAGQSPNFWIRVTVAIAVVAVIALTVLVKSDFPGQDDVPRKDSSDTIEPTSIGRKSEKINPRPSSPNDVSRKAIEAASVAPKEETPGTSAATKTQPTAVESTVTIEIVNLPPGAKVYVAGTRVSHPIQIARSSAQTELRVTCPGYRPYIQKVTPAKDLKVEIDMKRGSSRGTSKGRGRSDSSSQGWKNNPFSLKNK